MIGIATRKVHLIEVLIVVIAFGWGIFTWLDILSQFGRAYGLGRLGLEGAMWILAVGAMAWALMYWKALRLRALVPGGLVAAGFAIMPLVRSAAIADDDKRFLARESAFLAVLEQVRTGQIPAGRIPFDSFPPPLRGCCFKIIVSRDTASRVGGVFVTQMGFGPKFSGWLYAEEGVVPPDTMIDGDRYRTRQVTDRWHRISE